MIQTEYSNKEAAYFSRARTDIAPLLPPTIDRVLELGCGSGSTLAWLRQTRGVGTTVGIEIEPRVAEAARSKVDHVLNLDAEREPLPAELGRFDLMLCLDVLEHFRDPWKSLAELVAAHLLPGGTVIASVPNVRHAGVILPLLFGGHWTYSESGILDRTHLRFFTRESAIELMSVGGMQVTGVIDRPLAGSRSSRLNGLTLGLFAPFLAVQILVAASHSSPPDVAL
jgi:SAM-dependent methyltransferase